MHDADLFDDPRLTEVGLLFEAGRGLRMKLETTWTANGLSLLDFTALMRLSRSPGTRLRMTDLAAQSQLSTSGVTRMVDRLERNGLARREPDPTDRRSSYAVLTHAGAARIAKVLPEYLDVVDQWFNGLLTTQQRADLVAGLRIIRDATVPEAARVSG
ncbi:MarR family winged helix-turn-helix transcriptional regulator [Nocardia transvalensis]|uniref:MarR family winged helix-turn-helix transcriptional regulator n=1 Tax=Nocardia transvalensis TaxID=37333 RepID=UPI001896188E|nr:MarR family transcriptional regulator [Nocardia transvalensis]MBF6330503.1 MarR family transcriptional regulator [Nocardia transvalensis]